MIRLMFVLCLIFGSCQGLAKAAEAGPDGARPFDLYREFPPRKTCIIMADLSWDKGTGRRYKSHFMFDYMMMLRKKFKRQAYVKNIDFENFNSFTLLMNKTYCDMESQSVIRNIFLTITKDRHDDVTHMSYVKATPGYYNPTDIRDMTQGVIVWDYIRKMDRKDLKKCLSVIDFYDYSIAPYGEDTDYYIQAMENISTIFGFDIIQTLVAMRRTQPAGNLQDHDGDFFILVGGDCQQGMNKINYLLDWVDQAIAGKVKKPNFRFMKNPNVDKFLGQLPAYHH